MATLLVLNEYVGNGNGKTTPRKCSELEEVEEIFRT